MSSSPQQQQDSHALQIAKSIAFFRCIGRLKHTPRQGWVERKTHPSPPEAVAGHMYRMAVMAMIFGTTNNTNNINNLDRDKMIRMALVHDMCESIVGDVTPAMKGTVSKELKAQAEDAAVTQVLSPLLPAINGKEITDLFHEYEENITPEANFVHDLDILDMILQAVDYQESTRKTTNPDIDLSCFIESGKKIKHPFLQQVTQHIVELFEGKTSGVPVPEEKLLK
jgi:putative hydrolases of HD superfamily